MTGLSVGTARSAATARSTSTGHYEWERRKPLFLTGRIKDDALTLEGWRGPKRCRYDARRAEG